MKAALRAQNLAKRSEHSKNIHKTKSSIQNFRSKSSGLGHNEKFSGNAYKSAKG